MEQTPSLTTTEPLQPQDLDPDLSPVLPQFCMQPCHYAIMQCCCTLSMVNSLCPAYPSQVGSRFKHVWKVVRIGLRAVGGTWMHEDRTAGETAHQQCRDAGMPGCMHGYGLSLSVQWEFWEHSFSAAAWVACASPLPLQTCLFPVHMI